VRSRSLAALTVLLLVVVAAPRSAGPRFHPSDPMRVDDDRMVDVTSQPEEIELSDLYDRFGHIAHVLGDPPFPAFLEAANVNTLDEVPDSSWFTNRHGRTRMSLEALRRGPDVSGPPETDGPWTVFRGKSQGITPGFSIEDARGGRYVIKFDPVDVPELATAAEVIGTKLFHALGYHVPQNYLVRVDPSRFAIRPGTMVENSAGVRVPLTARRLAWMLRAVPRDADGRVRVLASRYIDGVPLGPFRYYGTRADDANDVIPHEHRRELRGLRLFAAWTNHDDTRAQNTQASWVDADGRHYVRHWLIDFGSTFGSGSVDMQLANLAFHYWLSPREVTRNLLGLGLHVPEYRRVTWPPFPAYQAVGRWEADAFDPAAWRNDYPNPAFVRMTARDAFWAAKILMRFTEEELHAIVETGRYTRPEDAEYFLRVLVARQRKAGAFGLSALNPLDEFQIADGALVFANLAEHHGFSAAGATRYRVTWSLYDNATGSVRRPLGETVTLDTTRAPLPRLEPGSDGQVFLLAEIRSLNADRPAWQQRISIFLRPRSGGWEIVGVQRDAPAAYVDMS